MLFKLIVKLFTNTPLLLIDSILGNESSICYNEVFFHFQFSPGAIVHQLKIQFKRTSDIFLVETNTFVLKWQSLKLIGTSLDKIKCIQQNKNIYLFISTKCR